MDNNPCKTPPPSPWTDQAKKYAAAAARVVSGSSAPPQPDSAMVSPVAPPWMKAVVRTGVSSELRFNRRFPAPQPKRGKVLIQVKAAALNPADYKVPKDVLGSVAGIDVAGIVIDAGIDDSLNGDEKANMSTYSTYSYLDADLTEMVSEETQQFRVGDAVFGTAQGALAEYVHADAKSLTLKPASLTFAEAAAMPTSYLSGLQALRDHGKMRPGARVMVIGASGGCGLAGVQVRVTG